MSAKKISELVQVTTASLDLNADVVPVNNAGATKKMTLAQLRSGLSAGTGISGSVAYWSNSTSLSGTSAFMWDGSNNMSLSPASSFSVYAPQIEVGGDFAIWEIGPEMDAGKAIGLYGGLIFGSADTVTTASSQFRKDCASLWISGLTSAATVTMPSGFTARGGRVLFLMDTDGSCGTHPVTLRSADGDTFNGSPTFVLNTSRGFAGFMLTDTGKWTRFTG